MGRRELLLDRGTDEAGRHGVGTPLGPARSTCPRLLVMLTSADGTNLPRHARRPAQRRRERDLVSRTAAISTVQVNVDTSTQRSVACVCVLLLPAAAHPGCCNASPPSNNSIQSTCRCPAAGTSGSRICCGSRRESRRHRPRRRSPAHGGEDRSSGGMQLAWTEPGCRRPRPSTWPASPPLSRGRQGCPLRPGPVLWKKVLWTPRRDHVAVWMRESVAEDHPDRRHLRLPDPATPWSEAVSSDVLRPAPASPSSR